MEFLITLKGNASISRTRWVQVNTYDVIIQQKSTGLIPVFFTGDLIGGFRYAQRKTRAYRRLYFSEPVVFFTIPDRVATKKATLLGGIRGEP